MTSISSTLSNSLKTELKKADEIWIAVGLLNNSGLQFILDTVNNSCKLNFIVGIDLPTDPKALSKLLSLKGRRRVTTKIMTEDFFHPKVYIIKSQRQFISFVGSANCTMGGLKENIEMSLVTKDKSVCKNLIEWFENGLLPNSQSLTAGFIKEYIPKYNNRINRRKKDKLEIQGLKEKEEVKAEANIKARAKLISALKRVRKSKDYIQKVKDRQSIIRQLRKCLDYPHFKSTDLKTFFSIKELGTIVPIRVKAKILADRTKFTQLMKFICNEQIPIKERIDEALNGKLSIANISEGFISKILVTHNSKKYYLHNKVFTDKLRPFGLELPRGLSFGEKYELTRDILQHILNETKIEDFATFDHYMENPFDLYP